MPPGPRPTPRPKPRARPKPTFETSPTFSGERNEQINQAQNAGSSFVPGFQQDQWDGMTPDQHFATLMGAGGVNSSGGSGAPGGGYGGSGGGRGGSGSTAPGNPDPAGWNAIAQEQNMTKGYGDMLAALDNKNAALMSGFDSRATGLNAANDAGAAQLARLLGDIQAQAGATRGQVAGSYQGGQDQLQQIMGQYQNMIAGRQAPAAQTLQAFGAAPDAAVSDPSGVQNMLVAQQANLARVGQADDALFANRSNVYNGMNNDVTTQRQQGFDMLMARLLADRQATEASGAAERAQLAMQQQQAMLQNQAQEQARRAGYV